jgi:hypothetical protein
LDLGMIAATARAPWLLFATLPLALLRHPAPPATPIQVADPPTLVDPEPAPIAEPELAVPDDGIVLAIATTKTSVAVGEDVVVGHAVAVAEGHDAWIVGPKPVYGEIVDGQARTEMYETPNYPWVLSYDGAVVPGPRVDNNFQVTTYRFTTPGRHTIVWSIGGHESNTLVIDVSYYR